MRAREFIRENSWREAYSSPYQALGLSADATQQQVDRAYKRLISAHHPDRLVNPTQQALQRANRMTAYLNTARDAIVAGWRKPIPQLPKNTEPLHPDIARKMYPSMPTRAELRRDREEQRRGEEMLRKMGDEIRARRQREFDFAAPQA